MKRRNHWLLFGILLLALINLSPSANSKMTPKQQDGETEPLLYPQQVTTREIGPIHVIVNMDENEFAHLQLLNTQFIKEHHKKIDLVNVNVDDDESYDYFKELMSYGNSPDIVLLDNVWVREFAAKGYLLPADSYTSASSSTDVLSSILTQSEWNGYVWGAPKDVDPYVLVYNSDILKQLGIEHVPVNSEEWSLLLDQYTVQQLDGVDFLALDESDPYAFLSLIWQMQDWDESELARSKGLFDVTPALQKTIQQINPLRSFIVQGNPNDPYSDLWNKLQSGELLFVITKVSNMIAHQYSNVGVKSGSTVNLASETWVSGRSYGVSARTENTETVRMWITAMTSDSFQNSWYNSTGKLPVSRSFYKDTASYPFTGLIPTSIINGQSHIQNTDSNFIGRMDQLSEFASAYLTKASSGQQFLEQFAKIGEKRP